MFSFLYLLTILFPQRVNGLFETAGKVGQKRHRLGAAPFHARFFHAFDDAEGLHQPDRATDALEIVRYFLQIAYVFSRRLGGERSQPIYSAVHVLIQKFCKRIVIEEPLPVLQNLSIKNFRLAVRSCPQSVQGFACDGSDFFQ